MLFSDESAIPAKYYMYFLFCYLRHSSQMKRHSTANPNTPGTVSATICVFGSNVIPDPFFNHVCVQTFKLDF